MANLNRIILVGCLTADPDTKFTVEGTPMTKFQLAVNRFRKEGTPQTADYIDVVAWRKAAEVCGDNLKKDKMVLVEGRIQIRSYEDQSGQRKWVTEIIARNVQLMNGNEPRPENNQNQEEASFTEEISNIEDDLPF